MKTIAAVISLSMAVLSAPSAFAEETALSFDSGTSLAGLIRSAASAGSASEGYRCHDFTFRADSPDASERVSLWVTRTATICRPVGDPAHGGTVECREEVIGVDELSARVVLKARKPLASGQSEVFRVCLERGSLEWNVVSSVYEYRRLSEGERGDVVLAPLN